MPEKCWFIDKNSSMEITAKIVVYFKGLELIVSSKPDRQSFKMFLKA